MSQFGQRFMGVFFSKRFDSSTILHTIPPSPAKFKPICVGKLKKKELPDSSGVTPVERFRLSELKPNRSVSLPRAGKRCFARCDFTGRNGSALHTRMQFVPADFYERRRLVFRTHAGFSPGQARRDDAGVSILSKRRSGGRRREGRRKVFRS